MTLPSSSSVRLVKWTSSHVLTEQEAEAKLRQEGYLPIRWHDVAGSTYPRHRHQHDECIWVLEGSITFEIEGQEYKVEKGDRLYLPGRIPHTAKVPKDKSVTYLVGQKP